MGTRVNGVSLDGGGMSNPMTTLGDLITGGASGTPGRLAVGAEGEVLTAVSGEPAWAPAAGGVAVSTATPQPLGTSAAGSTGEVSDAGHVHALPTALNTSLQAAPDTGWTAGGAGSASIAAGVATLTMTAAQDGVYLHREAAMSPHSPALEVTARITRTVSPGGDFHWIGIALASAAWDRGYTLLCQSDGNGSAGVNTSGSWATSSATAFPGGATLTSGTLWARLVITPTYIAWYLGVGASRPTSWARVATRAADVALLAAGSVVRLHAVGGRATGTGTVTGEVTDIQWRSLLGAPT